MPQTHALRTDRWPGTEVVEYTDCLDNAGDGPFPAERRNACVITTVPFEVNFCRSSSLRLRICSVVVLPGRTGDRGTNGAFEGSRTALRHNHGRRGRAQVRVNSLNAIVPDAFTCSRVTRWHSLGWHSPKYYGRGFSGDVPHFVEHCEAVAAEIDVKRRWLGEQGRRVSYCSGVLPERHVTREVACELSVVGSLWPLPA